MTTGRNLRIFRTRVIVGCTSLGVALALSCATREEAPLESDRSLGFGGVDGGVAADADGTADVDTGVLMCPSSMCPAPYATCAAPELGSPSIPCQVNLLEDRDNCGACGNVCPVLPALFNAQTRCLDGQCRASCTSGFRTDCNGIVDDGCETDVRSDPQNCGSCGHRCQEGVGCYAGACGCPAGLTECGGTCVNLKDDDRNCSACGQKCDDENVDAAPPPPNMYYGCVDAECPRPKCIPPWENCNGRIEDGCEVNLEKSLEIPGEDLYEPANCGACGRECAPDQLCARQGRSVACICDPGLEACHGGGVYACANLETDPTNCGTCGFRCPGREPNEPTVETDPGKHGKFECRRSQCVFECRQPYADCNNDDRDGCEVNLGFDPLNCGACGRSCSPGQLCIEGACAVEPCDAGAVQ